MKYARLELYQGDDYAAVVSVFNPDGSAADLSPFTARAQIRKQYADQEPLVAAELSAVIQAPNLIVLGLTHDQTAPLWGTYVWDLQLTQIATGGITTILAGKVPAYPEVTRNGTTRRKGATA